MNTKSAAQFTMKDASSSPYAWMVEGVEPEVIRNVGVEAYIRAYVKQTCEIASGTEYRASTNTLYKVWRAGYEFAAIEKFIKGWLNA